MTDKFVIPTAGRNLGLKDILESLGSAEQIDFAHGSTSSPRTKSVIYRSS